MRFEKIIWAVNNLPWCSGWYVVSSEIKIELEQLLLEHGRGDIKVFCSDGLINGTEITFIAWDENKPSTHF